MQMLLAALAGLLLLEARMRRDEHAQRDRLDCARATDVDFHPELIVAWDDEANYARQRPCTRSATGEQRELRRPLLVESRPHQQLR